MGEHHTRQSTSHGSSGSGNPGASGPFLEDLSRRLHARRYPTPEGSAPKCPDHPESTMRWDGVRGVWYDPGSLDCWTWTPQELKDREEPL